MKCIVLFPERNRANGSDQQANNNTNNTSRAQLHFPDESTLSRYVAARLDLGISQSLLNQNFKLSIIKRCWEDQLRLKRVYDLFHLSISRRHILYNLSW